MKPNVSPPERRAAEPIAGLPRADTGPDRTNEGARHGVTWAMRDEFFARCGITDLRGVFEVVFRLDVIEVKRYVYVYDHLTSSYSVPPRIVVERVEYL